MKWPHVFRAGDELVRQLTKNDEFCNWPRRPVHERSMSPIAGRLAGGGPVSLYEYQGDSDGTTTAR
jgi:hypothetical protein